MSDPLATLKPWIVFAGWMLIATVLYLAQAVVVPVVLSALLMFLLAPPTTWLERRIGRAAAVLGIVLLTFGVIGSVSWVFGRQLTGLATQIPSYQANIDQKISQLQKIGNGGPFSQVEKTVADIESRLQSRATAGTRTQPVVIAQPRASWGFPAWVSPLLGPLSTALFVLVMVIFMLLERHDLRNRLLHLFAHTQLAVTTRALDEAATRVSRYLVMQSLVNTIYGVSLAIGLALLGVPYALLWGCFGALARYIPYVGPLLAAAGPLALAFAALPGWSPLIRVGIFVGVLELLTNFVLETVLYAGAAGVSQVALLVAVAFWTWLWGPMGLLMATPLTVCVVVIGKHVRGLKFLATLMAEEPDLDPHVSFYQRVLAHDMADASDQVDQFIKAHSYDAVFDGLLLPVLNYAERDRLEHQLTAEEEIAIISATRELVTDVVDRQQGSPVESSPTASTARHIVLGLPVNGDADLLALEMLQQVMRETSAAFEVLSPRLLISELIDRVRSTGCELVCLADLPPSVPSKTRYLVKKLRLALPDVKIAVGRWAPESLADGNAGSILAAGATSVDTTILGTRERLRETLTHLSLSARPPAPTQAA